jgi:hypothetical protein
MIIYRANIKLTINSTKSNTWIEIKAPNDTIAKSLLQAQYGKDNVINVVRKSGK